MRMNVVAGLSVEGIRSLLRLALEIEVPTSSDLVEANFSRKYGR